MSDYGLAKDMIQLQNDINVLNQKLDLLVQAFYNQFGEEVFKMQEQERQEKKDEEVI